MWRLHMYVSHIFSQDYIIWPEFFQGTEDQRERGENSEMAQKSYISLSRFGKMHYLHSQNMYSKKSSSPLKASKEFEVSAKTFLLGK